MSKLNYHLNRLIIRFYKRYSISHWYGRAGNNIQQVANCLILSEKLGHTFDQNLDHELIKKFQYNFGKDGNKFRGKFFSWEPQINCKKNIKSGYNEVSVSKEFIYKNIRRICKDYILPNLKVPSLEPFDDDTLVIHIRGGDVFDGEFLFPTNYVQNPLSFYLDLIKKFRNVHIVTEKDSKNPVIDELRKNRKLIFHSNSLIEDYSILLAAKNIATSGVGTFGISAALCSKNLKNLFSSNLFLTEHLNCSMFFNTDVTVHISNLKNYIPLSPCSWKNDNNQRKIMLEYNIG